MASDVLGRGNTPTPPDATGQQHFEAVAKQIATAKAEDFYRQSQTISNVVEHLRYIVDQFRKNRRHLDEAWAGSGHAWSDRLATLTNEIERLLQTLPAYVALLNQAGDAVADSQQRLRVLKQQRAQDPAAANDPQFDYQAQQILNGLSNAYAQVGNGMAQLPEQTALGNRIPAGPQLPVPELGPVWAGVPTGTRTAGPSDETHRRRRGTTSDRGPLGWAFAGTGPDETTDSRISNVNRRVQGEEQKWFVPDHSVLTGALGRSEENPEHGPMGWIAAEHSVAHESKQEPKQESKKDEKLDSHTSKSSEDTHAGGRNEHDTAKTDRTAAHTLRNGVLGHVTHPQTAPGADAAARAAVAEQLADSVTSSLPRTVSTGIPAPNVVSLDNMVNPTSSVPNTTSTVAASSTLTGSSTPVTPTVNSVTGAAGGSNAVAGAGPIVPPSAGGHPMMPMTPPTGGPVDAMRQPSVPLRADSGSWASTGTAWGSLGRDESPQTGLEHCTPDEGKNNV
jgi:hypothetical protein